jgi:hypothetical protein
MFKKSFIRTAEGTVFYGYSRLAGIGRVPAKRHFFDSFVKTCFERGKNI